MAHEIAKLMLEHAGTFLERSEAVKTALYLGMPLEEIESYLDWIESIRGLGEAPTGEPKDLPCHERSMRKQASPTGRTRAPRIGPFGGSGPLPRPVGQ